MMPHCPYPWLRATAYRLLAALLLADRAYVPTIDLAACLFEQPVRDKEIYRLVKELRRFSVPVEAGWHAGYRLPSLPPDEHLEPMLAMVPLVKRSAWWQDRTTLALTA